MRKLYAPVLEFTIPGDETKIRFARLNLIRWALMAEELRNAAIEQEMKISSQQSDPLMAQTLRMRAKNFEPTLGMLIQHAQTPNGMLDVFEFAGRLAGTTPEDVRAFMVSASPQVIVDAIAQIIHQPVVDPKDVPEDEVKRQNPMDADVLIEQARSAEPNEAGKEEPPQPAQPPLILNSLLAELGPGSPR